MARKEFLRTRESLVFVIFVIAGWFWKWWALLPPWQAWPLTSWPPTSPPTSSNTPTRLFSPGQTWNKKQSLCKCYDCLSKLSFYVEIIWICKKSHIVLVLAKTSWTGWCWGGWRLSWWKPLHRTFCSPLPTSTSPGGLASSSSCSWSRIASKSPLPKSPQTWTFPGTSLSMQCPWDGRLSFPQGCSSFLLSRQTKIVLTNKLTIVIIIVANYQSIYRQPLCWVTRWPTTT